MRLLLISPNNVYATERLTVEGEKMGFSVAAMEVKELGKINFDINLSDFDALFIRQAYLVGPQPTKYLQAIINLAQKFQQAGKVVIDQNIGTGQLGRGKLKMLEKLEQQSIVIPKTSLLTQAEPSYPFIAKWIYGFGSKHTYFVRSQVELEKIKSHYPIEELMAQEFVTAEYEYKVITTGYKSLPVVLKLATNREFLPDLKQVEVLPMSKAPAAVAVAEKSAKILGRELAKTDILEANGQLYVLEVNRWPGFQYFEKVSRFNVANEFLNYIKEKVILTQ